jgi:hypothetical protein
MEAQKYVRLVEAKDIPLRKRILLRLDSLLPVRIYKCKAFTKDFGLGPLEYYYGYCSEHGYYVNYMRGNEKLPCPACP